jgi:hypothetical protein
MTSAFSPKLLHYGHYFGTVKAALRIGATLIWRDFAAITEYSP